MTDSASIIKHLIWIEVNNNNLDNQNLPSN